MTAPENNAQQAQAANWENPPQIHLVDQDSTSRQSIETHLRRQGFSVQSFRSGEDFLQAARGSAPEIVLIEVCLPRLGGIETISRYKKLHPETSVIFLADKDNADICNQAERMGTYDIILKPLQPTCIDTTIRNALHKKNLLRELNKLKNELRLRYDFSRILGSSPAIRRMVGTLKRLAVSDIPVLLHGERGSGKELTARTLHYNSRFADGPFLCVNCHVVSKDPLAMESEISSSMRRGTGRQEMGIDDRRFRAIGGTLFLDDITDLDLFLLNKLLQRLKRYGNFQLSRDGTPIDFRIICGTRENIGEGGQNLLAHSEFFRILAPFQVKIPSLRNRTEDIPILIKRFLVDLLPGADRPMPEVTSQAMRLLKTYPWPGNVRELRNVLSQAFHLTGSNEIGPEDLPPSIREFKSDDPSTHPSDARNAETEHSSSIETISTESTSESLKHHRNTSQTMSPGSVRQDMTNGKKDDGPIMSLRQSEILLIRRVLNHTGWNMKRTASLLGISRPALYRRIEKLGITRETRPHPQLAMSIPQSSLLSGDRQTQILENGVKDPENSSGGEIGLLSAAGA